MDNKNDEILDMIKQLKDIMDENRELIVENQGFMAEIRKTLKECSNDFKDGFVGVHKKMDSIEDSLMNLKGIVTNE